MKPRVMLWLTLTLVVSIASMLSTHARAGERVPDRAALKARVAEYYRSFQARDEQALRALVLPQIIACGILGPAGSSDGEGDESWDSILSWKIRSIEPDLYNFDTISELCSGYPVHATAGAAVIVKQTAQEPGHPPTTDEVELPWIYVNATWYWLVDWD